MRLAWRTASLLILAATLPLAWLLLAQPAPGNLPTQPQAQMPSRPEDWPTPTPSIHSPRKSSLPPPRL